MSVTIIIVSYKSDSRIQKCLKNLGKKYKKIIIDTSKDMSLKTKVEKKFPKTKVILTSNNGYGAAMNYGVKKAKTKYIIHLSPDLTLNFNQIKVFFDYAKKLNDHFCALGPRFLNTKKGGSSLKFNYDLSNKKYLLYWGWLCWRTNYGGNGFQMS